MVFVLVSPVGLRPGNSASRRCRCEIATTCSRQGPGESSWYVITVELIPPMTSLIVANFLGAALYAVLARGLQFVGLGNLNANRGHDVVLGAEQRGLQTGLPLWALARRRDRDPRQRLALLNYAFDEVANPRCDRYEP